MHKVARGLRCTLLSSPLLRRTPDAADISGPSTANTNTLIGVKRPPVLTNEM
jgi:hypothetical protein